MPYRTQGRVDVIQKHEYSLTREEVIEAIALYLQQRGHPITPTDATDSHSTTVMIKSIESGKDFSLSVEKSKPLKITWYVIDGEQPQGKKDGLRKVE